MTQEYARRGATFLPVQQACTSRRIGVTRRSPLIRLPCSRVEIRKGPPSAFRAARRQMTDNGSIPWPRPPRCSSQARPAPPPADPRAAGGAACRAASIRRRARKDAGARREMMEEVDLVILCLRRRRRGRARAGGFRSAPGRRRCSMLSGARVDPDWVYGLPKLDPGPAPGIAAAARVRIRLLPDRRHPDAAAADRGRHHGGDQPVTLNACPLYRRRQGMVAALNRAARRISRCTARPAHKTSGAAGIIPC